MATYQRKGSRITNVQTGEVKQHGFINEAKRASRTIQMDTDGALGRGAVTVLLRKGGRK